METYTTTNGWTPNGRHEESPTSTSYHSISANSSQLYLMGKPDCDPDSAETNGLETNGQNIMQTTNSMGISRISTALWTPKGFESHLALEKPSISRTSIHLNACPQEQYTESTAMPVELQVSNLDQTIDAREMKKILLTSFREHVMVLHVSVFVQSDGGLGAYIRVPSIQDAQLAISQLQRKKIGIKRIIISHASQSSPPPEIKRSKIVSLLQEVPGKKLPLFKFRELFERRYHETVGTSELYNMREIVTVSDNNTGRMVSLNAEYRAVQPLSIADSVTPKLDELKYCKLHSRGPDLSVGWAERDQSFVLPNVHLGLSVLAEGMQQLLQSHDGKIPLASLYDCYRQEIGGLDEHPEGVPIEHLVTCIPWLTITDGQGSVCRYVQYCAAKTNFNDSDDYLGFVSPSLISQLSLFSRELVDLLKTFPFCRLLFSRFIPAYHHHFGRQCRVADYGYTKLVDLFDALPHVVQILGEGKRKIITLEHKAQIKRFSSDLIRVLKNQPAKVISTTDLPLAFEKILTRPFNVCDYGVCEIEDLLDKVGDATVLLTKQADHLLIAIPKREQTSEEVERTRQFSLEVVELLRHSPQCMMQFNRFIPAYHHHFGRQCKVADYGFAKLIELFEATPDYVTIVEEDDEGEKILQLVEKERLKVLSEQVSGILRNSQGKTMNLQPLANFFTHYYGYSFRPSQFNCETLKELMEKIHSHVEVIEAEDDGDVSVKLVDRSSINELLSKTRTILWEEPKCQLEVKDFISRFNTRFKDDPDLSVMKEDLAEYIEIEDNQEIRLSLVQIFARDLIALLSEAGGRMLLSNFESAYYYRFGMSFRPVSYGYSDIVALIQSLNDFVVIKGRGAKRILVFNKETPIPLSFLRSFPSTPVVDPPTPSNYPASIERQSYKEPCDKAIHLPPPIPPSSVVSNGTNQHHTPSAWLQHKPHAQEIPTRWPVGSTPPSTRYQPTSPVIFPGSPVNANSRMMWGQVWSPQYSVIQPLSPHYVIPSMSFNWNVPPLHPQPATGCFEGQNFKTITPVSIKSLDQQNKIVPPRPEELPIPEMFHKKEAVYNSGSTQESTYKVKKRLAAQFQNLST